MCPHLPDYSVIRNHENTKELSLNDLTPEIEPNRPNGHYGRGYAQGNGDYVSETLAAKSNDDMINKKAYEQERFSQGSEASHSAGSEKQTDIANGLPADAASIETPIHDASIEKYSTLQNDLQQHIGSQDRGLESSRESRGQSMTHEESRDTKSEFSATRDELQKHIDTGQQSLDPTIDRTNQNQWER